MKKGRFSEEKMVAILQEAEQSVVAVIDVETTGLNWKLYDRVCEIGIVLLSSSGEILDIYETLVNPERDLGPTHIHGLDAAECLASPRFEEIAGDVLALLARAGCVAGHNVCFDRQFLGAEFKRMGASLEESLPSLCTLRLTRLKLQDACDQYDVPFEGTAHSALADAMATANLIRKMAAEGIVDLSNYSRAMHLPSLPPSFTPPIARKAAQQIVEVRSGFLSSLSERVFYDIDVPDDTTLDYLALLASILEDRVFDDDERELLHTFVDVQKMSREQVHGLHELYLTKMAAEAWSDHVITEHEQKDLKRLARLLDLDESAVDVALERVKRGPVQEATTEDKTACTDLAGMSVCFTGAILSTINGEVITRAKANELAGAAGLVIKNGVSKKLDMLVVADPNTNSGKAKKARECGTRIIAERDFFPMIGVALS